MTYWTAEKLGLVKIQGRYYFADGKYGNVSSCAFEQFMVNGKSKKEQGAEEMYRAMRIRKTGKRKK